MGWGILSNSIDNPILRDSNLRREIITGSNEERRAVETIVSHFQDHVDWIDIIETPVDTWFEEECVIMGSQETYRCVALPYTRTSRVYGKFAKGRVNDNEVFIETPSEDMIVFIEYPREHDLAKYVVLELIEKYNVSAIVFYDKTPGLYRRTVVNYSPLYSFESGSPVPIPIVSVDYDSFRKLLEKGDYVEIDVKTRMVRNTVGRTVLFGINGGGSGEIHLTAHHDHWFTGFSDNLVGLAILYRLASNLKNSWNGPDLVLISYTAEEFGSPGYASWYWSWGSRYYLELLEAKNYIEKVVADINIDAIYDYPIEIYGNPVLAKCIDKISDSKSIYRDFDNMDFDSYSYSLYGVPSLTLTSIESLKPIYHSNYDDGRGFNYTIIDDTYKRIVEVMKCIGSNEYSFEAFRKYLINSFGDQVPLETKTLVTKTISLINNIEFIREITKQFFTTTYTLGLKQESISGIFSDILFLKKILNNIEEYRGRVVEAYCLNENILYLNTGGGIDRKELLPVIINTMIRRTTKHSKKLNDLIYTAINRMKRCS